MYNTVQNENLTILIFNKVIGTILAYYLMNFISVIFRWIIYHYVLIDDIAGRNDDINIDIRNKPFYEIIMEFYYSIFIICALFFIS
jgi:hypothetical protein